MTCPICKRDPLQERLDWHLTCKHGWTEVRARTYYEHCIMAINAGIAGDYGQSQTNIDAMQKIAKQEEQNG